MVKIKAAWKKIIARALAAHAAQKGVEVPMPGAEAVVLERTSQPADHPVLLNFPESRYLKGFIIEIRA